jgi:hypothetical protein
MEPFNSTSETTHIHNGIFDTLGEIEYKFAMGKYQDEKWRAIVGYGELAPRAVSAPTSNLRNGATFCERFKISSYNLRRLAGE